MLTRSAMAQRIKEHPLRRWRKSQNLTLAGAAAQVGTVRQVWHDWESGRRRPGPAYMPRLREATKGAVTADDFYPTVDEADARRAA